MLALSSALTTPPFLVDNVCSTALELACNLPSCTRETEKSSSSAGPVVKLDPPQCPAGVVRGCGRQLLGASINVCTYWLLGLPFAMILGFPLGLHVAGLWWGMAATTTLQGLTMGVVISRFNWETEVSRAAERMAHKPSKLDDVEQGLDAGAQLSVGSGLTTGVVTLPVQHVQESQLAVMELGQRTP